MGVGDIMVIPAGVPHGWTDIPSSGVTYLSVRPDSQICPISAKCDSVPPSASAITTATSFCRADHDGADGGVHVNGLAMTQGQFCRLLFLGMHRHRHLGLHVDLAALERLEQQIKGHHLGERGGVPLQQLIAGERTCRWSRQ